jgi:hypothetical protein
MRERPGAAASESLRQDRPGFACVPRSRQRLVLERIHAARVHFPPLNNSISIYFTQCNFYFCRINLAAKDKMVEPAYQELKAADIPKQSLNGVDGTNTSAHD